MLRAVAPLRRSLALHQRYGLLLLCLLVLFFVLGVAPAGAWEDAVVTALAAMTLIFALRAGHVTPRVTAVFTVVGTALVIAVVILAASGAESATAARLMAGALVAVAPPAIVVGVVRGLRATGGATIQAIMGVLCIFLLMGMFYAFLYGAMDELGGHPFFTSGAPATASNCLYFSFTTLTTVGFGDLTARSDLGHTLATTEALFGQIYLVTVVAVLVSGLGRSRGQTSSGSDDGGTGAAV
jgi:hypothetical protein